MTKYYDHTTYPQTGAPGSSAAMRSELAAIETGFDLVSQEIEDALTGAAGAVTTATTQAGIATTQAGIATTQAGLATSRANTATTQAGIATTQAGIATTRAAEAAATKAAVDATYDEFEDRYLGRKASDPTVDNDGNALQEGTLYFNTTSKVFRGFNGTVWINLPATTASNVVFSPAGNIEATTVQTALQELDAEKLSASAGAVGATNIADGAVGTDKLAAEAVLTTNIGDLQVTPEKLSAAARPTGKQTIWIPSSSMSPRLTLGAASGRVQLGANATVLQTLDFDSAAYEYAQFSIRMPKGWDESNLTYSVTWTANSTSSTGVVWALRAKALSNDETIDASWGSYSSLSDLNTTTAYQVHLSNESTNLVVAGASELDWVTFEILRVVDDAADTLAADALLIGLHIYYTAAAANDA